MKLRHGVVNKLHYGFLASRAKWFTTQPPYMAWDYINLYCFSNQAGLGIYFELGFAGRAWMRGVFLF